MSIKIYDGLQIAETAGNDIFDVAHRLRAVLDTAFFAHLDRALEVLGDQAPREYAAIHRRIVELDRTATWTFDLLDIAYKAVLLPGRQRPLVLISGEKASSYVEVAMADGIVRDYGYWDNVDPDEGLSEEQWELRRLDWGRALSRPGRPDFDLSPVEAGLTISSPGAWPIYQHLHPTAV